MSNKDHIDDLFRRRFEEEERTVSDRLWENIKKELPPENEIGPGFSWTKMFFAGLLSVSIIATILIIINSKLQVLQWESNSSKELVIAEKVNLYKNDGYGIKRGIKNNDSADAVGNENKNTKSENYNDVEEVSNKDKNAKPSILNDKLEGLIRGNNKIENKRIFSGENGKTSTDNNESSGLFKDRIKGNVSGNKNRPVKNEIKDKIDINSRVNQPKIDNQKTFNDQEGMSRDNKEEEVSNKSRVNEKISGNGNDTDGPIKDVLNNQAAINSKGNHPKIDNQKDEVNRDDNAFVKEEGSSDNKNINNGEDNKDNKLKQESINTKNGVKSEKSNNEDDSNTDYSLNKNKNTHDEDKLYKGTVVENSQSIKNDNEKGVDKAGIYFHSAINNSIVKEKEEAVIVDTVKQKEARGIKDTALVSEKESKKKKEANLKPFSFDIFLAPSVNYRSLSGSSNEVDSRNEFEKQKLSLGGGIRVNYALSDKLSVGSGLAYSNYGEKYKGQKDSIVSHSIVYTAGYYVRDSIAKDSVFVPTDSTMRPNNIATKHKSNNQYKYLSIPLFVTYNFGKGKLNFSLSLGLCTNILLKGNSERLAGDGTVIKESSSSGNNPYRPVTFSMMVSPAVIYDFKQRWKLFVQPGITYFISSIYKDGGLFVQRPYAVDLQVGVRYCFK